jgi:hypothetical protein
MSQTLRAALFVSLSWHFLFFGVFEPTFVSKVNLPSLDRVAFLGSMLQDRDFLNSFEKNLIADRRVVNLKTVYPVNKGEGFISPSLQGAVKPPVYLSASQDKKILLPSRADNLVYAHKEKPPLTFYPALPYSFLFYFKDRQIAHIEFTFYVSDTGKISLVKRKVSSGNLDTDLLAYRYITHCLFLQEGRFPVNTWQTVKIDLTRKEND